MSHETVRRALQHLEDEGLITKVHGLGTIVNAISGKADSAPPRPAPERTLFASASPLSRDTLSVQTCEYGPEKRSHWEAIVAAFQGQHPQIHIQLSAAKHQEANADLTGLPDVVHTSQWRLERLAECNVLLNLSPWLAEGSPYAGPLMADLYFDHQQDVCWAVPISFDWEVWPLPLAAGEPMLRVTTGCAITKACRAPEAAMRFVRFLASPQGQALMAAGKTNMPVCRQAAHSSAFVSPPPRGMQQVVESLDRTFEFLQQGGRSFSTSYRDIWDEEIAAFLLDGQSKSETTARIATRCRNLIRAYGVSVLMEEA